MAPSRATSNRRRPSSSARAASCAATSAALIAGSWHLNGSLHRLDQRVQDMVQAADTLALHPLPGGGQDVDAVGASASAAPSVRAPTGKKGRFALHLVNTGEEVEVTI